MRHDAALLTLTPGQMEEQEAALAQELGADASAYSRLLCTAPSVLAFLAHGVEELEHAAWALALVGVLCLRPACELQGASYAVPASPLLSSTLAAACLCCRNLGGGMRRPWCCAPPQLLMDGTTVWRRSLHTLALLWVPDPSALVRRSPQLLCAELAGPECVATRLLLEHTYQLPAAAVYERLPGAAAASEAPAHPGAPALPWLELQGMPLPDVGGNGGSPQPHLHYPAASALSLLDAAGAAGTRAGLRGCSSWQQPTIGRALGPTISALCGQLPHSAPSGCTCSARRKPSRLASSACCAPRAAGRASPASALCCRRGLPLVVCYPE